MRRLSLQFDDPAEEAAFRADYNRRYQPYQRLTVIAGLFLYGAFGWLDVIMAPESVGFLWTIRYAIVIPTLVLWLVFSWVRPALAQRMNQHTMAFVGTLSGLGIVVMTAVLPSPADYLYYAGLILVIMFIYTWGRLRVLWANAAGWSVVAAYEIAALIIKPLPWHVVVSNNFFLLSAVVVGAFAGYTLERQDRRGYLDLQIIDRDKAQLTALNQQLVDLALRDHLTGLLNRRFLDERLVEAVAAFRRYQVPTCLMLIDLDGFKEINDQLGHAVGDDVLRAVAGALQAQVRDTDLVYRYGGDEFCIVMSSTTSKDTALIGARIVEALRSLALPSVPGRPLAVGFSAGCVPVTASTKDARALLAAADELLYRAKRAGKGRVLVADQAA